jgi:Fe-S cluster biogenesis protein NfuA
MNSTAIANEDIISRIEASLNGIRPYLEADGGNIKVLEVTEDKTLRLEFMGNCGSCPMSTMTFKAGVEEAVRRVVPEIKNIEVINLA